MKKLQYLVNKILWYPFNLFFCNLFPTIQKITVHWFHQNYLTIDVLSVLTFNLLGFFDAVAYFMTPSVQFAWGRYLHNFIANHPQLCILCAVFANCTTSKKKEVEEISSYNTSEMSQSHSSIFSRPSDPNALPTSSSVRDETEFKRTTVNWADKTAWMLFIINDLEETVEEDEYYFPRDSVTVNPIAHSASMERL